MNDNQIIPSTILAQCLRFQVIPLSMDQQYLTIAAAQGYALHIEPILRFISHRQVKVEIWPKARIEHELQQRSSELTVHDPLTDDHPYQAVEESVVEYEIQAQDDEPVVKFINQTLEQALQRRASDVHFEPYAKRYRIRFRIDGVLQEIPAPPLALAPRIAARLKIMAKLNIAERRIPQDGQLSFIYQNSDRALRISTLPVAKGEKIVLRVMESNHQQINIQQLGLPAELQAHYLNALSSPQGLILVTGPTGSGKTMTLYSGLQQINDGSRNICSVEDPVEIPLEGVNQTQINPKAGLLFSNTLRAFLRQDPDVLMIGEIRDQETAEIAIEAAQTGHLVLSTLHTNSTTETLIRLSQMGIATYLLASSLKLVVAQRLVRCLCQHCHFQSVEAITMNACQWLPWQASGCEHCFGGYYGRTAIYEMLLITPAIQQALLNHASANALLDIASQQGMQTLFENGLLLAQQGVTSLAELYRTLDNPC